MTVRSEAPREAADGWLILDTETTGLGSAAEPVEIAVVDHLGAVRFHRYIQPRGPVEREAARLHGLSATDLVKAPPFRVVRAELYQVLDLRTVIAYNADFDRRVLDGAFLRARSRPPRVRWACALAWYGAWRGFTPGLATACEIEGLPLPRSHRALEDALALRRLVAVMIDRRVSTVR